MELEKLKKLISGVESFRSNPACRKLVENFEEFIELYQMGKEAKGDVEYLDRFEKCLTEFWSSFDEAALSLGIAPEVIKENMHNPEFFTEEEWKNVQALQKEVNGEESGDGKIASSSGKKLKKKNKSMRI